MARKGAKDLAEKGPVEGFFRVFFLAGYGCKRNEKEEGIFVWKKTSQGWPSLRGQ